MDNSTKRNLLKGVILASSAWIAYNIINGISKKRPLEKIIEKTAEPIIDIPAKVIETTIDAAEAVVETIAEIPKVITDPPKKKSEKKIPAYKIKGSPEAKAHMASLKAMNKTTRGKGKRAIHTKKKKAEAKNKEDHKGHDTKKGLALDQKKKSEEKHEKAYRKKKKIKKTEKLADNPKKPKKRKK